MDKYLKARILAEQISKLSRFLKANGTELQAVIYQQVEKEPPLEHIIASCESEGVSVEFIGWESFDGPTPDWFDRAGYYFSKAYPRQGYSLDPIYAGRDEEQAWRDAFGWFDVELDWEEE